MTLSAFDCAAFNLRARAHDFSSQSLCLPAHQGQIQTPAPAYLPRWINRSLLFLYACFDLFAVEARHERVHLFRLGKICSFCCLQTTFTMQEGARAQWTRIYRNLMWEIDTFSKRLFESVIKPFKITAYQNNPFLLCYLLVRRVCMHLFAFLHSHVRSHSHSLTDYTI